ncbi:hypothetical protein HN748_00225 [Candidatus Peregrinibacteria bacterium]|jgi:hypothetical protein|nr:hypothetical protein [Candidatus Peregrinibacteria bacterium]MBT7483927.1 hypothetical protein [Candidatus Peregrinibacteria bacterium]MBT7702638.1 hypothetical protein [Candidatus Peregrinibacteria bacterium]
MDNSVYLAQLLGPILVLLGFAYALRINTFEDLIKDFGKSKGMIHVSVMLMMLGGMALVLAHNVWEWGWPLVITILGWSVLLKGLLYAFAPDLMIKWATSIMKYKGILVFAVLLWVVFGLCLTYYGYFA